MPIAISLDLTETIVGYRPRPYEYMLGIFKDFGYKITERQLFRAIAKIHGKINFANSEGLPTLNLYTLLYELGVHPCKKLIKYLSQGDKFHDYFVYEDSLEFLKKIKNKYRIFIITNSSSKVHKIVRELNLTNYIDKIVASCDLGIVKPNPKIFAYAKGQSNILFHIGDVYEVDYIGASRAFIKPILLDRFNFYPEIKQKAINFYDILRYMEINRLL
ncbi:HAD family hydrolase [Acidianus manzaensis]|uniref:2-haloalkanoic acid dehalogenase n=1 Tax=Acidianus manzaensis TaxID=282676 RepID=A0A1W6JZK7_9CREN|nr:HAD family hydrolase [Acidianus manzaensis]ARM75634.1 2-haloalkanoic acid dehalogenase [Acidianus manzaensis]